MQKVPPTWVVKVVESFRSLLNRSQQRCVPPNVLLMEHLCAHWTSQAISVAAQLEVADHLLDGTKSIVQLGEITKTNTEALHRLLRALSSIGIFREEKNGNYALTELARPLCKSLPGSMYSVAIMMGSPLHWGAWGELLYSVRTGDSSLKKITGMELFEFLGKNPDVNAQFNSAMSTISKMSSVCIASAYDFAQFRSLVDVGGGQGYLISAILKNNPKLNGILFDLPHVISSASQTLELEGTSSRCKLESGSFLESVYPGADAYMARNVIHDWNDDSSIRILKNIRTAMKDRSRVLLMESVIPKSNEPFFGKFLDLEMLTITSGGKERTREEFSDLFKQSGFRLNRIYPTASFESIIEGIPE